MNSFDHLIWENPRHTAFQIMIESGLINRLGDH
jgi:hypothetical protein